MLSVIVLLSARFLFIYEVVLMLNLLRTFLSSDSVLSRCVMGPLFHHSPPNKAVWPFCSGKQAVSVPLAISGLFRCFGGDLFHGGAGIAWPVLIRRCGRIELCFHPQGAVAWFGGITGDVLGASVEGTEVVLWMTLWLLHYSAML